MQLPEVKVAIGKDLFSRSKSDQVKQSVTTTDWATPLARLTSLPLNRINDINDEVRLDSSRKSTGRASFPMDPNSSDILTPKSKLARDTATFLFTNGSAFRCNDCRINFSSQALLNRHTTFSTIHKETLTKLASQKLITARQHFVDGSMLSPPNQSNINAIDKDEFDSDHDEDTESFRDVINVSNRVHFAEHVETSELEARVLLADMMTEGEIDNEEAATLMKNLNSGWSRAVSKIRMQNEFARINQLLSAQFKFKAYNPLEYSVAHKVLYEGTRYLQISQTIQKKVDIVLRHLADERTCSVTPSNVSVVEIVCYEEGSHRMVELARTYIDYDDLTVILHDEILLAAAEYRQRIGIGMKRPDKDNLAQCDVVSTHSTHSTHSTRNRYSNKSSDSHSTAMTDCVVDSESSEISTATTTTAATSTARCLLHSESSGTSAVVSETAVTSIPSNSTSTTHGRYNTNNETSHKTSGRYPSISSKQSGRDASPTKMLQTKDAAQTSVPHSSSNPARSNKMMTLGKKCEVSITSSELLSSPSTKQVSLQSSSSTDLSRSALSYQQSLGHGHQFHDGVERRVSSDIIVQYILSHLEIAPFKHGTGYNLFLSSAGNKVGDVLGAVLDQLGDISSPGSN